jgi:hypothetical protein
MSAAKIATSLPRDQFLALEKTRKRLGLRRSEAVQRALAAWLAAAEESARVAQYVRGYMQHPDDPREARALVRAWARGLEREDW